MPSLSGSTQVILTNTQFPLVATNLGRVAIRSSIALWKVDDSATQRLMADFYATAWDTKRIVSRAEALRSAQVSMLKEGRRRGVGTKAEKLPEGGERLPPYYWAAFVLSGDWR